MRRPKPIKAWAVFVYGNPVLNCIGETRALAIWRWEHPTNKPEAVVKWENRGSVVSVRKIIITEGWAQEE